MNESASRYFWIATLIAVDGLMLFLSFYLTSGWVYGQNQLGTPWGMGIILATSLLSVYLFSGYVVRRQLSFIHIPGNMSVAILCAGILISALGYATQITQHDIYFWRNQFLTSMICFGIWLMFSRVALRIAIQKTGRADGGAERDLDRG